MGATIKIDDATYYLGTLAMEVGVDVRDLVEVTLVLGDGRTVHIETPARMYGKKGEEQWLTREQVQEMLQLSRATVEKLLRSGQIPASRVGRLWRIGRKDLEDYLTSLKPTR